MAMDSVADQYSFKVSWLPFVLRPEMPREGKAKAPNTPDNPRVGARLKAAGQSAGVNFTGKCDRYPNTVRAHMLTDMAKGNPKQDVLATRLLEAYFTHGDDVANVENLVKWGVELCGLDAGAIRSRVSDDMAFAAAQKTFVTGQRAAGVSGVPYFFFNGEDYGISGAQNPESFVEIFAQVAAKGK